MNKIRKYILIPIAVLALAGATPSCATYEKLVSPATNIQYSSYTVVGAEKSLRAAKDTFDLFFGLVKDNHDFVVEYLPQVYSFAQEMQIKAPATLKKANRIKNVYKYSRTSDNQTDLNTIMATVAQLVADTQRNSKELQNSTP